jgi:hypothetical protein
MSDGSAEALAGPSAVRSHAFGIGVISDSWFISTQVFEYTLSKVNRTWFSAIFS